MYIDWFCDKCTLQFDKKYVFDLHLSLVHGVEMKVKSEPQDCDKNSLTSAKIEVLAMVYCCHNQLQCGQNLLAQNFH